MRALDIEVGGVTGAAGRARGSTVSLLYLCPLGLAVCASRSTLAHAQAATRTRDARATHEEGKNMTQLNTIDAPKEAWARRAFRNLIYYIRRST